MSEVAITEVKSFNQKIRNHLMQIEEVACLCGSGNCLPVSRRDRHGLWSPVVICKICGLVYANPRLTDAAYRLFYNSDTYRRIYEGPDYLEDAERRFNENEGMHIFQTLIPVIQEHDFKTVMEMGCGAGWNLFHFYRYGIKVTGYDYSPALVDLGRSKGLNLITGSFEQISGEYDVIILNHVMEHFTKFFESIGKLCQHLRKDGILYINVPNIDFFSVDQLQNAHTYYFTPRTFEYYLGRCGLRMIMFGYDREVNMYGIFGRVSKPIEDKVLINNEYSKMMDCIKQMRFKAGVHHMLEVIGMTGPVLKLYRSFRQ